MQKDNRASSSLVRNVLCDLLLSKRLIELLYVALCLLLALGRGIVILVDPYKAELYLIWELRPHDPLMKIMKLKI